MTIVDVAGSRKTAMDSYRKRLLAPRRAQSEPPHRSERLFFGIVRYFSLRDKRKDKKIIVPRFCVSMVSIPSSADYRRSLRKRRRQWLQQKKDLEKSLSSSSSFSVPSEPRLKADMDDSGEEIPPEPHSQVSIDFDDAVKRRKSPSRRAILVNGQASSSSSTFEIQKNFEIERLQLSSPPVDNPSILPDNWNLKDSYKKDLEFYINNSSISNPWADPFEEDRRSRTEQWLESVTPGGQDSEELPSHLPATPYDPLADSGETSLEEEQKAVEKVEEPTKLKGVEAEVEIIWKEEPVKKEGHVLHDVIIKLNGEPVSNKIKHQIPHVETQDSLELPPSEVSFVSSTIEKESLVKQNYRSNLKSALEHSGDTISLNEVERFWNYQYNNTAAGEEDERKRRKELEKIRGTTPTMERVVLYYTSDKRPSLITISPSPVPSVRSNSSFSDAYRLFDRKSTTPSPRPKVSQQSLESDELFMYMEKDNLAEEITIEVPQLAQSQNTNSTFFHLDQISSDEDDAGGQVEVPEGKVSPVRLFLSPHPRLRKSRGTSTEDLQPGSSVGRSGSSTHPEKQYQSKLTQTMDASLPSVEIDTAVVDGNSLSDVDGNSIDELLAVDFRADSSSPSKCVHFAQKIDADIESLPKHQRDPLFRCPKSILKRMDSKANELRRMMELAADRVYKDLRMLVEERDRCVHALEVLLAETKDLSFETAHYQTSYRDKLMENKGVLDAKIDHFWNKLRDLPLNDTQAAFVYAVEESKALTLNVKRKIIPARYITAQHINVARRSKTNLEMASDYARKLADMRKAMIRRDSDIVQDDEKSVEEILRRVSTSMANLRTY